MLHSELGPLALLLLCFLLLLPTGLLLLSHRRRTIEPPAFLSFSCFLFFFKDTDSVVCAEWPALITRLDHRYLWRTTSQPIVTNLGSILFFDGASLPRWHKQHYFRGMVGESAFNAVENLDIEAGGILQRWIDSSSSNMEIKYGPRGHVGDRSAP